MSETLLRVNNLCKVYPTFQLKNVSFSINKGEIMGFIGRNGAGKTTTLKSLLNLVHPVGGTIEFFGKSFAENEKEIKQRIGYAAGEVNYYPKKKIKTITDYTKMFFDSWDEKTYKKYMDMFELDENKKPCELSCGMKVKYNLALALSHNAQLLILDEPTGGLDPVSRDDLLNVFLSLQDNGVSILFSTHITSDLDKCADCITYIKNGEIIESGKMDNYINSYRIVNVPNDKINNDLRQSFIGTNRTKNGYTGLIKAKDEGKYSQFTTEAAALESIMVHIEKGN